MGTCYSVKEPGREFEVSSISSLAQGFNNKELRVALDDCVFTCQLLFVYDMTTNGHPLAVISYIRSSGVW